MSDSDPDSAEVTAAPTFSFHVPFDLSPFQRINFHERSLRLSADGEPAVHITSIADKLSESEKLSIKGRGFPTPEAAKDAGERWRDAVSIALVHEFLGPDFLERVIAARSIEDRSSPGQTEFARQSFGLDSDVEVLTEVPGVTVHSAPTTFVRLTATGLASKGGVGIAEMARDVMAVNVRLDPSAKLAVEMYSAAQYAVSNDAQFLMLMVAIEALIDPQPLGEAERALVDKAISEVASLDIDKGAKASIEGRLRYLRVESIRRAGMRLFESLGERAYAQPNARRFFDRCYEMRSTIVHGGPKQPTSEEVMAVVGPLNWAVRDLIERHVGFRPTSGSVDQAAPGSEDRAESGD